MYFAPKEHPPPHFHVYYGEYKATVDIRTCEIIEGNLPKKQTQLALAWAEPEATTICKRGSIPRLVA